MGEGDEGKKRRNSKLEKERDGKVRREERRRKGRAG